MKKFTLRNDFHSTHAVVICTERVKEGDTFTVVTDSQAERACRQLCADPECFCATGAAGTRGPQRTDEGGRLCVETTAGEYQ